MPGKQFQSRVRALLFLPAVVVAITVFLVLMPFPAFAQLSSASVTGVVRDSTGSVIPNVKITLQNVATTVSRTSVSNTAGNYVFLGITPGSYTLQAEAPGFEVSRMPQFTLAVNQTATLDLTMQVGTVQQSLTVEATGQLVQSATAELGAVVEEKQVVDLPLNGRNFTQLLSLTPGVAPVSVSQNSGGFGNVFTGGNFVFPAINGQTNRSNFFLMDGINDQGSFQSTYTVAPIVDQIEEFKVNSHNDQAEFGGVLGGVINVVTKSGTNQLHGSAWEYLRNNDFDARNTFQSAVTPYRQNQFGVAGGGPVWIPKLYNGRNKTFFFGAFEGTRFTQAQKNYLHLPTDAELAGNLSGEPQAFNPFTTRPDPANPGNFLRDPFPGNQIPSTLINQTLVNLVKQIRPPIENIGIGNFNASDSTPYVQTQNQFSARLDQTLGSKDFIWFRYSGLYYDTTQSGGLPGFQSASNYPAQNYGASWVHTFSPSLVLQAQFGRAHQENNGQTVAPGLSNSAIAALGFADTFAGQFIATNQLLPSIGIAGYNNPIPGTSDTLDPNFTNVWQYKANVSKIIGSHTLRFGGEMNTNTFESLYASANIGYALQQTNNPSNSAQPGNAMASFLLDVPDNANRRNVHETTRWGGVMGFYFQDSWKASPRLTVNLGLRYDRTFQPPYGTNATIGQNGGIETGETDFNNGTYIIQKLPPPCSVRGHAPCIPGDGTLPAHVVVSPNGKIYHDTTTNWGPRLGLAYRVTDTFAIRAGFGIFYDNWAAVTQTAQNYEGDWPDTGQQIQTNLNVPSKLYATTGKATPNISGFNPFSGAGLFPGPTPFNQVQWMMDPLAKNPYSMQWNFGIAKQLNHSTTVSADYVGSGSRRLDVGGDYNTALTPGPGNPQDRAPYPYIGPTFYDRSVGRGNYNALQFLFDKRFANGLAYQVSYTWSKVIDTGSDGWYGVEGFSVQNPYTYNNDRSVAGYDLTHTLSVNVVYEVPIGKGHMLATRNNVLDYIIGGWQVNAIGQAHSGLPYTIFADGDIANTGNAGTYERADLVGDPNLSHRTAQQWFNPAAFAIPQIYTFGSSGRNIMRGPAFWNVDASLFRKFPLWERTALEFRAEAFNTPNTVILGQPGNNVSEANFGVITGTQNSARIIQFGLKLTF
ncbi:MAG: TonB-dependent receptor [Bryobacteraceae bacterium]